MSDQIFQVAYARVRGRHTDQEWFRLTPRQITEAIYSEIRVVDQEHVAAMQDAYGPIAIAAE